MRILNLTLKKKWFDMIASGRKLEEYRQTKEYWHSRLAKEYDAVRFRNGYSKDAPTLTVELLGVTIGFGMLAWGAPCDEKVYILHLGDIIGRENIKEARP
jgi:hypothetical protein